ncbi:MAG: hypothetical protein Q4Q03_08490, partial [Bowdeniella nasicola]|nr:hypothetical protein [Bowdeniella nasicola]
EPKPPTPSPATSSAQLPEAPVMPGAKPQESPHGKRPAPLPTPPATSNQPAPRVPKTPAAALPTVDEARYAEILTGELPRVASQIPDRGTAPSSVPSPARGDDAAVARPPRRRPVAPPTTAQGVRVMDHATGEVKTITPEQYTSPTSQEHTELQARIDAALPTPPQVTKPVSNAVAERSPEGVDEPGDPPTRVSLLGRDQDEVPGVPGPAATELPSRRSVHQSGADEDKQLQGMATWVKVLLAVLIVIALAALVWVVANQNRHDAADVREVATITDIFEESSA